MECRLCGHPKTHKHGKMPNGHQRYFCPHCKQTFSESFDTLYYYRHTRPEQIDQVLQAHSEGGYERVLPLEMEHSIGKDKTQRLERTNGIVRQQTGRWHRRQNKFGKVWEQTKVTVRLVVSYFNWIWQHSRYKTTAAQRAGLTDHRWSWRDILAFPTII